MPAFPLIEVRSVRVRYGEVVALDGASLTLHPGECLGLVGHNGAGKSTLVNVLNGSLTPQEGDILADGTPVPRWDIPAARASGLRCVFQELSLCPNLTVIENTRIMHRDMNGSGWRKRARSVISQSLDTVFPGHGIDPRAQVGDLSIAERQMVEIAMAFSDAGTPPRLVILDEPTSSLDAGLAAQLLEHVARFIAAGGAIILISHIMGEILSSATRIVVMKDARIVTERPAAEFDQAGLVEAMGSTVSERSVEVAATQAGAQVLTMPALNGRGLPFTAARGEVIGLAGLGGHGQTDMLLGLFDRASPAWWPRRDPAVTFVAGDRRLNGSFDGWSILRNLSIASLSDMARRGFVDTEAEAAQGRTWRERIGIRTPDMGNPILSLSGGNQQKVLFARSLATRAPVVLMDDPMRGVDIGTKQEVYGMIRAEAAQGRTFVWYSTEMEEARLCDRVYVFRNRMIVAELAGAGITEQAILAASFEGQAA
ncbi:MAG: sugar ABC transporter ATP-binding protein [Pseudorhodobacter sp.]